MLWFFLMLPLTVECQNNPSTITVIGKSENIKNHIGYISEIEIEDESNKCDSKYPMSSEEKLGHLLSFKEAGYHNFAEFEKIEKFEQNRSKLIYKCIIIDSLQFVSFLKNCEDLGITIKKSHFYFGPKDYKDEYEHALSAFNNAYEKAMLLSKKLGVSIKNIVYIDDFTTFYSPNFHLKPAYNEIQLGLYNFGRTNSFFAEFEEIGFDRIKKSSYTLKVVFEVE